MPVNVKKGGRKGSKGGKGGKGGKGSKGKKTDGKPRRLRRGDDVSLSSGEDMSEQIIEDDESIDDDMAFGSSDEELKQLFGDVNEKEKTGKLVKGGKKGKKQQQQQPDSSDDERIYGSDEEVGSDDESSSDDEENNVVKLSELLDTKYDKIAAKKKKSSASRVVETKAEDEFQRSSIATVAAPSLSDLVNPLNSSDGVARLGKKLRKLRENDSHLVAAPEDTVIINQRERGITKEGVSNDLSKWNHTVRAARAKDFSQFPLPEVDPIQKPTTSKAGETIQPVTDLEKEISGMLQDSGLREEQKELTSSDYVKLQGDVFGLVGEGENQTGTLSKLKNVLSYEHEKKKRVKKIKSKTYRRMVRREKEKDKDKRLELLALVDPEAALKKKKEEMLKMRAKERLSMKHRNKSQWIKHVKDMAKWDPDTKAALANQNRIHQKLMTKIDEDAEDAEYINKGSDVDSLSSDGEKQIDTLLNEDGSKSALWKLRGEINEDEPQEKKKGVWGMKFMQRSKEKNKEELLRMVDELEEDVDRYREGEEPMGENRESETGEKPTASKMKQAGKMSFSGHAEEKPVKGSKAKANKGTAYVTDDTKGEDVESKPVKKVRIMEPSVATGAELEVAVPMKSCLTNERSRRLKLKKELAKRKAARTASPEEPPVEAAKTKKRRRATEEEEPQEEAVEEAVEEQATEPEKKKKKKKKGVLETSDGLSMNQDYLVARAFAADTLTADFEKEKEEDVQKDVEGIDATQAFPGWGEWGGQDETLNEKAKKRKRDMEVQREEKVAISRAKRKDAKLKNVIINENEDTLDSKYAISKVPFPFRNPEQFQATLQTPLGSDWNTAERVQSHIRPKMKTKSGEIITPLEKEQGARKAPKTKRRKITRKGGKGDDE
eukprot:TRINITY_DN14260_c3_g1_i1.p1 TRINITY_DN14260_c3_g1~~TRINITY_DN14260_c3_g1_i1.p1  ORF type:complete len:906 (+),score=355.55 TRINITY_DN14260_c3_g1_i1:53-2719(+)